MDLTKTPFIIELKPRLTSVIEVIKNKTTIDIATVKGAKGDKGDAGNLWIHYATGWSAEPLLQASTLDGEVYKYQYLPNVTYYRYIANDGSIDAFYDSFTFPDTLGNLIVEKRIII